MLIKQCPGVSAQNDCTSWFLLNRELQRATLFSLSERAVGDVSQKHRAYEKVSYHSANLIPLGLRCYGENQMNWRK